MSPLWVVHDLVWPLEYLPDVVYHCGYNDYPGGCLYHLGPRCEDHHPFVDERIWLRVRPQSGWLALSVIDRQYRETFIDGFDRLYACFTALLGPKNSPHSYSRLDWCHTYHVALDAVLGTARHAGRDLLQNCWLCCSFWGLVIMSGFRLEHHHFCDGDAADGAIDCASVASSLIFEIWI